MLGETGASRAPGAGDNDDHGTRRDDTVRVTVRKPDGGEVSMPLGRRDSVAQLRAMIRWCWANNHWEYHAIPRDIRHCGSMQPGKPEKADDEMWTLNEQADCLGLHDDADAPEDLENSHRRANGCDGEVIENAATGHIEILHGPVMLQDGWLLCECGVEDGSFLHPLYTLRGGGGAESRSWSFTAAQLPWCDREWYRAGTNLALAAASSWWAASAPPPRPSAERPGATEVQDRCLRFKHPTTDDQLPGLFGSGPRANGDDDGAL